MSNRKPLVLDDLSQPQQLQGQDSLDIPVNMQVQILQRTLNLLLVDHVNALRRIPPGLEKEYQMAQYQT